MRWLAVFLAWLCDRPWYHRWSGSEDVLYLAPTLCLRCSECTQRNEACALQGVRAADLRRFLALHDYWEYTNAWHANPYNPYGRAEVDRVLAARPAELKMERLRRRFFGAL